MSDYRIFANHAHLFPKGSKDNAQVDDLKRMMYECEIEKAVCFGTFTEQNTRAGYDADTRRWLAEEIKNEPSLVGFGTVDFDRKDLRAQVKEIKELGLLGIKIHPAYQEVKVDSPQLFEVYAAAEEEDLFISFHTGLHWHRISDYQMLLFDEVAWNFPKLRFSMEHIGGYTFFKEALLIMNNYKRDEKKHIFAGWTSIAMDTDVMGNERAGAWSITDDQLCTLVHQVGYETSIFGLDFPYKKIPNIKESIERVKNLPIPEEAKHAILGGNLRRELNID